MHCDYIVFTPEPIACQAHIFAELPPEHISGGSAARTWVRFAVDLSRSVGPCPGLRKAKGLTLSGTDSDAQVKYPKGDLGPFPMTEAAVGLRLAMSTKIASPPPPPRHGLVLSDLHLLARRSDGAALIESRRSDFSGIDVLVLNGDTFDFRWSALSNLATSVAAALFITPARESAACGSYRCAFSSNRRRAGDPRHQQHPALEADRKPSKLAPDAPVAMSEQPKPKVTCYSEGEGKLMQQSQAVRGRLLRPLLTALAHLRVTPDQLTLLSLAAGLAFCPVFLWGPKLAAFGLLLAHVLLDGLDGPLARHLQRASNRGSFADTTADQVVVTFSTVTLIHAGHAGAWPGGLYIFFYCSVVIFAMVRSALAIPYAWLVRPRFMVYAWMPIEVYLWPGSLDGLLWAVTLLLAVKMLTGFMRIRRQL